MSCDIISNLFNWVFRQACAYDNVHVMYIKNININILYNYMGGMRLEVHSFFFFFF